VRDQRGDVFLFCKVALDVAEPRCVGRGPVTAEIEATAGTPSGAREHTARTDRSTAMRSRVLCNAATSSPVMASNFSGRFKVSWAMPGRGVEILRTA